MRNRRLITVFIEAVLILVLLAACSNGSETGADSATTADEYTKGDLSKEAEKLYGSWAYIYDKETAVITFNKDGTARYDDKEYTFESDGLFVTLVKDDEMLQMRYVFEDEGMFLYDNKIYEYSGEGQPEGLTGSWKCPDKSWSFTFTSEGTFVEDGIFSGKFTQDTSKSTFILEYNDAFADTECYYRIEDDMLYVQYPWSTVRIAE